MFWGTRTLVLALLVLLYLGTTNWAAPQTGLNGNQAVPGKPLSDKQKRDSDSMSEIVIEHMGDDDSQAVIPLLVGLLLFGTLILLALLLLGCLLLFRVAESKWSRYQRLESDDPDLTLGHSVTSSKPSQTFTYVDLSNVECACQERAGHTTIVQPKFAVQFQAATKVESSQGETARRPVPFPAPAPRRTKPGAGLAEADSGVVSPEPITRNFSAVQKESRESVFSTASQGPPKKRSRKGSPEGARKTGGRKSPQDNCYWERNAVIRSHIPSLEVDLRERGGKVRHKKSPKGDGTLEGQPETYFNSHVTPTAADMSVVREIDFPMGPYEVSSTTSPEDLAGTFFSPLSQTSSESSKVVTQTRTPEDIQTPVFGPTGVVTFTTDRSDGTSPEPFDGIPKLKDERVHGQYYEPVPSDQPKSLESHLRTQPRREDAKLELDIPALKSSKVKDVLTNTAEVHDKPAAARSVTARTSDSLISVNSSRLRRLFEEEAAKSREAAARTPKPSAPSRRRHSESPKKKLPLSERGTKTTRRPHSAEPQSHESIELSVPVPQMIAYFDRGQPSKQGLDKEESIKTDSTDALRATSPEERRSLVTSDRALAVYPDQYVEERKFDSSSHHPPMFPEEQQFKEETQRPIEACDDTHVKNDITMGERELFKDDSPVPSDERGQVARPEATSDVGQFVMPDLDRVTREPHTADTEPQSRPSYSKDQPYPETTREAAEVEPAVESGESSKGWNILAAETPGQVREKSPEESRSSESTQRASEALQEAPSESSVSAAEADFMASRHSRPSVIPSVLSPVTLKIKLPHPPSERARPEPEACRSGQEPTLMLGSAPHYKRRHDEHSSTEPFSLDERRESTSCMSSDLDISTGQSEKDSLPSAVAAAPAAGSLSILEPETGTTGLLVGRFTGTVLIQPESSTTVPSKGFPSETTGVPQPDQVLLPEPTEQPPEPRSANSFLPRLPEDLRPSPSSAEGKKAQEKSEPVKEPPITAEHKRLLFPQPTNESELADLFAEEKKPSSFEGTIFKKTGEVAKDGSKPSRMVAAALVDASLLASEDSAPLVEYTSPVIMPTGGPALPYGAEPWSPFPDNSPQIPQKSVTEEPQVSTAEKQLMPESKTLLPSDKPDRTQHKKTPATKPPLRLQKPDAKDLPVPTRSRPYMKRDSMPQLEYMERATGKAPSKSDPEQSEEWKREWLSLRDRLLKTARATGAAHMPDEERRSAPTSKPRGSRKEETLAPRHHSLDGSIMTGASRLPLVPESRQIPSTENGLTPVKQKKQEFANLAYPEAAQSKPLVDYRDLKILEGTVEAYCNRPLVPGPEKKDMLLRPQSQFSLLPKSSEDDHQLEIPEMSKRTDRDSVPKQDMGGKLQTLLVTGAERQPQPISSEDRQELPAPVFSQKERLQLKPEAQVPLHSKPPGEEIQPEGSITSKQAGGSPLQKPAQEKKRQELVEVDSPGQRQIILPEDQGHIQIFDQSIKGDRVHSSIQAPGKEEDRLMRAKKQGPIMPNSAKERPLGERPEVVYKDAHGRQLPRQVLDGKDQDRFEADSSGQVRAKSPEDQRRLKTSGDGVVGGRGQSPAQALEKEERQQLQSQTQGPSTSISHKDNTRLETSVAPRGAAGRNVLDQENRGVLTSNSPGKFLTLSSEDRTCLQSLPGLEKNYLGSPTILEEMYDLQQTTTGNGPVLPESSEDRRQVEGLEADEGSYVQLLLQDSDRKDQGLFKSESAGQLLERSSDDQRQIKPTEEGVWAGDVQPLIQVLEQLLSSPEFPGPATLKPTEGADVGAGSPRQFKFQARSPDDRRSAQGGEETVIEQGPPSANVIEMQDGSLQSAFVNKDAGTSELLPQDMEEKNRELCKAGVTVFHETSLAERRQLQTPSNIVGSEIDKPFSDAQEDKNQTLLKAPEQEPSLSNNLDDRQQSSIFDMDTERDRREMSERDAEKKVQNIFRMSPPRPFGSMTPEDHAPRTVKIDRESQCLDSGANKNGGLAVPSAPGQPQSTSSQDQRPKGESIPTLTPPTSGSLQEETNNSEKLTRLITEFPDSEARSAVDESQVVPITHSGVHRIGRPAMFFSVPKSPEPLIDISTPPTEAHVPSWRVRPEWLRDGRSAWSPDEPSPPNQTASQEPQDPSRPSQPGTSEETAGNSDPSPPTSRESEDLIQFGAEPATGPKRPDSGAGKRSVS